MLTERNTREMGPLENLIHMQKRVKAPTVSLRNVTFDLQCRGHSSSCPLHDAHTLND